MSIQSKLTLCLASAGRRVELLQCLRSAASSLGLSPRVLAADLAPGLSSACAVADAVAAVPRSNDPEYAPAMLRICSEHGVKLVVPTIDTELPVFAAEVGRFAKQGVQAVISSVSPVAIARDKLRTAEVLSSAGTQAP